MIRNSWILFVLLGFVALPFLAKTSDGAVAFAPEKGFVYVQTNYPSGARAPYVPLSITKLSGNYPVPPGPYATDRFGKVWVALYPGVYRFRPLVDGASPTYIDVGVASRSESYIFFQVPESSPSHVAGPPVASPWIRASGFLRSLEGRV